MKRKDVIIGILMLVFCMPVAQAQESVEVIRTHYYAVKERISEMEAQQRPFEYYQVKVAQNLPGTGGHEETVNMYYGDREDHEIWPSHWLELVTTHYNFAARQYYEEYLFHQNGDIAFIYARNPDVEFGWEYDFRFYFDDGLQKVDIRRRKINTTDFQQVYDGDEVPQEYHSFFYQFTDRIKLYRILFNAVDENRRS